MLESKAHISATMQPQHLFLVLFLLAAFYCSGSRAAALPRAADFAVKGLENVEPAFGLFQGEMYAGQLPMDNNNGKDDEDDDDRHGDLMFWLFAPEAPTVDDSLVIWFNGGPGCSSISTGLLFEDSPVTVRHRPAGFFGSHKNDPFEYNRFAWTNATAMLYVEQPVGVGYSQGGPAPKNEEDLAGDFYAFYQNFLKVFPEYQPSRLHLVGESYGGMYVPAIARRIHLETEKLLKRNKKNMKEKNSSFVPIRLAGIALGNGWMDARIQGSVVIDYAYWHGLIDAYTKDSLHREYDRCLSSYTKGLDETETKPFHQFTIPDECAVMEAVLQAAGKGVWPKNPGGPNTYDVTTWDMYPNLIDNDNTIARFMNNARVKELLHAPKHVHWQGCIPGAGRRRRRRRRLEEMLINSSESSDDMASADGDDDDDESQQLPGATLLAHDVPESTVPYVAELLDAGIQVLIYNGDRDLSTCAQGSEMLLNSMHWSGAEGWRTTPRGLWVVDNNKQFAGYAKRHKGLGFVVVYNSGHMVPTNVPAAGLDLITRFLTNQTFLDHELPVFDIPPGGVGDDDDTDVYLFKDGGSSSSVRMAIFALSLLLAFASGYWLASRRGRKDYEPIGNVELES